MPEYILKSDALALDPAPKHLRQYQTMNLDDAYEDGWYGAQAAISQLSPADVRPIVCGHWTNLRIGASGNGSADCSRCDATIHSSFSNSINFCPKCGSYNAPDDFCSFGIRKIHEAERGK